MTEEKKFSIERKNGENEYSEAELEHRSEAERLTNRLIENVVERKEINNKIYESYEEFQFLDVTFLLNRLTKLLMIIKRVNDKVPCLLLDNRFVPLDILQEFPTFNHQFLGDSWQHPLFLSWKHPLFEHYLYEILEHYLKGDEEAVIKSQNNRDVINSLHDSLTTFLTTRIFGIKSQNNNRINKNVSSKLNQNLSMAYLNVVVKTNKPGLQISFAPAYFISWMYFGAPTTPVSGHLQPGRYIFGGRGSLLPKFTYDPTIFKVPPNTTCALANI